MSTADRQPHYVKQNERLALTPRQERRIRKTGLRLDHGRHRTTKVRHGSGEAVRGRKSSYARWIGNAYRRWLREARRHNPRAKLGRFTPPRDR
jgi:hypothetical protein